MDTQIDFDEREGRLIVHLANKFQSATKSADRIRIEEIEDVIGKSENNREVITKFGRLKLLRDITLAGDYFEIYPSVLGLANQIQNPPKRNHFKEVTEWWFSTRWRALITVGIVILPLIVKWIEMIQFCVRHLTGPK